MIDARTIKKLLYEFTISQGGGNLTYAKQKEQERLFEEFVEEKMTNSAFEKNWSFSEAVSFAMKWQCENTHPMTTIIIRGNSAELVEGVQVHNDSSFVVD